MRHARPQFLPASSASFEGFLDASAPDIHVLADHIRTCSDSQNLCYGRYAHHCSVDRGLEDYSLLCCLFVHMYAKCASLEDAERCFSQCGENSLEAWNCLIGGYADNDKGKDASKLFQQMQQQAVIGDNTTIIGMLSVCANEGDGILGRQLHVKTCRSMLEHDVVVGTAFVNMYGKVGSMDDSHKVFCNMYTHNVVSWSCMISLLTKYSKYNGALQSFDGMLQEGVIPNTFTFVSIISACACQPLAKAGKNFHSRLAGSELEQHPYVANALTNMYSECGNIKQAEATFNMASKQGTYSWNMILAAYAHHGNCANAIKHFDQMLEDKTLPDATTYICVLSACASQMALAEGMYVHNHIALTGLESEIKVANTLLNLYGKCKCLDVAKRILQEMAEHDVVSWNTLISSYAYHNLGIEAFNELQQMIQEGMSPNLVTYTCVLDAFSSENLLTAGKQIHACIVSEMNVVVTTALINMYAKCGCLQQALQAFHCRTVQNVLLWNVVIAVCNQHERGEEALNLFMRMNKEDVVPDNHTFANIFSTCASQAFLTTGKEAHSLVIELGFTNDIVVVTALINLYGKCGSLADAMWVFETAENRDVVLWTSIIQASSQHGCGRETMSLLKQMQKEQFVPNHITFLSALSACSRSGLLHEGRRCFTSMQRDYGIIPTDDHYGRMIDLLARSGQLEEAEELIKGMPFQATYVSWTTLLGACKKEHDFERGERIGKDLINLFSDKPPAYVMLVKIYEATGRECEAEALLSQMRERGIQGEAEIDTNCEF